jgi:hypothetical protein
MPFWIELDRRQFPSGLRQRPSDPHAGVTGGGANLKRSGELVLEDEVMQQLAVGFRDVQVSPRSAMAIQERSNGALLYALAPGNPWNRDITRVTVIRYEHLLLRPAQR